MTIGPPPPCPSILSEIERNARQMRALWEALVKERDDLRAELASERLLHRAEITGMQGRIDVAIQELNHRPSWADHNRVVEGLQKERDQLRENVAGYLTLTDQLSKKVETLEALSTAVGAERREEIRQLKVEVHDASAAASLARQEREHREAELERAVREVEQMRFTVTELGRQRETVTAERNKYLRELDYLKTRPATVNEAGVLLGQLVRAKALHERGDDEAYKKAKDGLWERAFALVGEPMPKHLDCPSCGTPHIDQVEPDPKQPGMVINWATRPHKTHLCAQCGHTWRPEERCHTVGVARPPWQAASPDALAQVFERLKLDASVVPRTGPLPQTLVNQLDDINAVLEEAATRNLNILADKSSKVTISAEHFDSLTKAYRRLAHINTAMGLPL